MSYISIVIIEFELIIEYLLKVGIAEKLELSEIIIFR